MVANIDRQDAIALNGPTVGRAPQHGVTAHVMARGDLIAVLPAPTCGLIAIDWHRSEAVLARFRDPGVQPADG
ncbi:MAG: hypothetical protein IPG34_11560 [Rhodocyclaceae bacterium]|nr:hypothetical protein [Rhodocyclaceae bacterium]